MSGAERQGSSAGDPVRTTLGEAIDSACRLALDLSVCSLRIQHAGELVFRHPSNEPTDQREVDSISIKVELTGSSEVDLLLTLSRMSQSLSDDAIESARMRRLLKITRQKIQAAFRKRQEREQASNEFELLLHSLMQRAASSSANLEYLTWIMDDIEMALSSPEHDTLLSRMADARDLITRTMHMDEIDKIDAANYLASAFSGEFPGVERSVVVDNPATSLLGMLEGYIAQADHRGIDVVVPDKEDVAEFPNFKYDEYALERVYHNVLVNALKYSYHSTFSPYGKPIKREIIISVQPRHDADNRMSVISFQNYGIGIEEDELALVTTRGYRGRRARDEVQLGTGLGLSESLAIMNSLGGFVDVASKEVHEGTYLTTVRVVFRKRA